MYSALPSELLVAPQPLIGFYGLDVTKNSIHKSIFDAFNTNRKPDRVGVQFKILPTNYEFPVSKPKRPSYEWYHPKGILKRNWMLKHLHVLPAVVVLFQDLEWNDPQWSEKQIQCASILQSLKNNLQGRNTRLALVLLQKSAPLPASEDLFASERAASLTTACAISAKMLFVLPHSDHLMGYTVRLESAFLEMAQSYYSQMSKRIRMHRDQLTSAHQTLRIRHQFKLGFISEMRLDYSTAMKHYSQAYSNLEEIRIIDTNCLEIKTIAGFLNYKICRLMFKLNIPRDAITHFINHIDKYKSRVGFKELLFEHYAWLSTQHSAFAELFCEAIKNGLPALQTQHPGIYFHKAAEYITKRKEAFLQCCSLNLSPTEPQTPNRITNPSTFFSEFFGIRTIKSGEPFSEQQAISLAQENERCFNHSAAIIYLLQQAMGQFKIYKCLRFRKKLTIDMAEEYFKCGDHSKALTLYSLMLPDYRQDKWESIFTDVLLKTLRCAFLSASVADFISCSIEALSLKVKCDHNERIIVLENLWKVFQNVPPVSQSQIAPELRASWEQSLAAFKSPIAIDLDKIIDFIECIISFDKSQINNDETVTIKLFIRSQTDVPLKIRGFSIVISDGKEIYRLNAINYNLFSSIDDLRENELNGGRSSDVLKFDSDFKLESNYCYKIIFDGESQQFLENVELQVSRLEIDMGTDRNYIILTKSSDLNRKIFKSHHRFDEFIDNINYNPSCYVVPTFHLVTQNNQNMQPMLVNEYFKVISNISNPFNMFLQNVGISISVPGNLRNKVFLTTDLTSTTRQKLLSHIQIDIGELGIQSNTTITYYVYSLIDINIELKQKIWYQLEMQRPKTNFEMNLNTINNDDSPTNTNSLLISLNKQQNFQLIDKLAKKINTNIQIDYIDDKNLRKLKEDTIIITCMPEFKFVGRFYTLNRQPLMKGYRGEDFLLRANIEIQSKCDLDILETYFICDHNLMQSPYSFKRKKHTSIYSNGETFEDVILLRSNASTINWITKQDYEMNKIKNDIMPFNNKNHRNRYKNDIKSHLNTTIDNNNLNLSTNNIGNQLNKNLLSKIPINTTIIGNNNLLLPINNLQQTIISPLMNVSSSSDDLKLKYDIQDIKSDDLLDNNQQLKQNSHYIYNKAIESIQATGHCKGFFNGLLTTNTSSSVINFLPIFGIFCIKWKRNNFNDENESKFIINGIEIIEPIINIYCKIEEKMFVKIPMCLKIILKNPTSKVLHLIAQLSTTDNFMCSGHKQLNISIFSYSEQEILFNLYPLKVGWQNLPELTLEYNTQVDLETDELQKLTLSQLVQRSMPKKVFILPPLKQHLNYQK